MEHSLEEKRQIKEVAESILGENVILNKETREKMDVLFDSIMEVFTQTISKDKEERENQWTELNQRIMDYGSLINEIKYNLQLDQNEYLFLKDNIINKFKYNRENCFYVLDIMDELFEAYDTEKSGSKTSLYKTTQLETFALSNDILIKISHLTSSYEVKGYDKSIRTLANITKKFANISYIIQYLKFRGEEISLKRSNFALGFDVYDKAEEVIAEKI